MQIRIYLKKKAPKLSCPSREEWRKSEKRNPSNPTTGFFFSGNYKNINCVEKTGKMTKYFC